MSERWLKAAILAAVVTALSSLSLGSLTIKAHAQATTPPPLTQPDPTYKPLLPNLVTAATGTAAFQYVSSEKQSPLNPYPNGLGDAQNRARGSSDVYWGIADAGISWLNTPLARARVEDLGSLGAFSTSTQASGTNTISEDYTSLITLDGWSFPRLSSQNGSFYPPLFTNDPNYNTNNLFMQEVLVSATADGSPPPSQVFTAVTGPSTNVQSKIGTAATYYEAPVIPRPAIDAVTFDANSKFVWRLDNPTQASALDPQQTYAHIPGAVGQQVRYRIIIHVPTAPDVQSATPENRIDDARYVVYYYVLQNGAYVPMQNICIASQIAGGDIELKNLNGSTAFFPFFSSATFPMSGSATGVNLPPQPTVGTPVYMSTPIVQGITLDDTSGDNVDSAYAIADTITLEPSFDTVSATPTITPAHGGAVVGEAIPGNTTLSSVRVQPKSYLPDLLDPLYNTPPQHYDSINNIYNSTVPTDGVPTVQSFINNIDDTAYAGTGYAAYQPWNVSTVFEGPSSLIDPRYAGIDSSTPPHTYALNGAQIGLVDPYLTNRPQLDQPAVPTDLTTNEFTLAPAQSANATNNWVYGATEANPIATPAPYFSHIQVIIARTEFAQDPNDPSGTSTIQVGAIYALDWQTGAPVWRFPDRSYLPTGATFQGVLIPGAGARNPVIGTDNTIAGHPQPIFQVPGIVAVDRNGDGLITDDEIYLGTSQAGRIGTTEYVTTAGNNVSGGVYASVTVAPRVLVQGNVMIPVHPDYATEAAQVNTNLINGVDPLAYINDVSTAVPSQLGRYSGLAGGGGPTGDYGAVPVGMAFIAAANGCLYAVDAYGNNDTRYFPGISIPNGVAPYNKNVTPNGLRFGQYLAGTTNVFWSFNSVVAGQLRGETTVAYHERVEEEVPATNSFGSSAPVLAWNYTDTEIADYYAKNGVGYLTPPELRLFVGNTNGVLYAFDPTATTGIQTTAGPDGTIIIDGTGALPVQKGVQPLAATPNIAYNNQAPIIEHQGDLRWWFQTQGAINMSPAVSLIRHNMGAFAQDANNNPIIEKAVYVGTQEGRIYALDWDGPVNRTPISHGSFLSTLTNSNGNAPTYTQQGTTAYDGSILSAGNLNDDYYFHNVLPATTTGQADLTYGNVRPRWTYPNLYFDIGENATPKKSTAVPDVAQAVGPNGAEINGIELASASSLGPIANAPVLMDFWWQDPDAANQPAPPSLVDYVAFVANDPTVIGTPATQSRVYLLDAIGDRVNLLTNPRATPIETTNRRQKRVISQPRDKYSPHVLLASASDPTVPSGLTWTYRYQNDVYEAPQAAAVDTPPAAVAQTAFDVQLRNSPFYDVISNVQGSASYELQDININTLDPSVWQNGAPLQPVQTSVGGGLGSTTSISGYIHQPERRMLPTLFVGGIGEAYALDIDPETALFMRWRPSAGGTNPAAYQEMLTPLPNRIIEGVDNYPGDPLANVGGIPLFGSLAPEDALDPPDHVFDATNNGTTRPFGNYTRSQLAYNGQFDAGVQLGQLILARYYGLEAQDLSLITSLTVSGGPVQNRNNIISEYGVAQANPSVPAFPTNDVPNLRPFAVATVTPPTTYNGQSVGANPSTTSLNQAAASTNTTDYNGLQSTPQANALVPGGHVTGAVNQDINDPITTTRGRISSLPLSTPGISAANAGQAYNGTVPAIPNAAFQYPILFATTTGSYLHGISTNIEGEDRQGAQVATTNAEAGDSRPVGWAFLPGNYGRFNADHTQVFLQFGPGGPSGIADMSNVYYPAIDPYALAYRNTPAIVPPATTTTPYSLNETPNFIADEPNLIPMTPGNPATGTPSGPNGTLMTTVTDPDDPNHPRPDFKPRPLTAAQLAVPNMFPSTTADTNTGDTGFPLDLNGLFFDRQFAGAAPALVGVQGVGGATQFPPFINDGFTSQSGYDALMNYNNDNQFMNGDYHVWLRPPGYSNIGARLISSSNAENGSLAASGVPTYGDNNNQIAEGVRHNDLLAGNQTPYVGQHSPSPFPQIATAVTGPGDIVSDDINPAGQNVTWIYTGSSNGAVYAFTPSIIGHESGAAGGEGFAFSNTNNNDGVNGGSPQVGIFPPSFIAKIFPGGTGTTGGNGSFANLRASAPSNTVSALGGKNYYEWGETVYIVVYDLLAEPFGATNNGGRYQNYVPGLAYPNPQGGLDNSVQIIITDKTGGTQLTQTLSLSGRNSDGTGALLQYYNNGGNTYLDGAPATRANGTPLGIAIYKYKLTSSPSATKSQTPGSLLEVSVVTPNLVSGGVRTGVATERPGYGVSAENAQTNGIGSYFSIANPLAIQGFLAATQPNANGQIVPLSPLAATGDFSITNQNANTGIGPFVAASNQGLPGEAGVNIKMDDQTALDPNKAGAEYWQALTNGNTIQRIDLNPYLLPLATAPAMSTINPHFTQPVITKNGITEPAFYMPVMTSPGYVNHGTSQSTAVGTDAKTGLTQQYLRIMNRSLLPSMSKVRALPIDTPGDLLFRAWPGVLMNDDADAVGTAVADSTNARNYPTVMDPFGRINPLPWETQPAEAKPWNAAAPVNNSPDYPDVLTRTNSGTALQIMTASGDLTATPGTLTSIVSPPLSSTPTQANPTNSINSTISTIGGTPPTGDFSGVQGLYSTALSIKMPLYQPANLAATPNETSTYVNGNRADFAGGVTGNGSPIIVGTPGPVQLPRGATARLLYTTASANATASPALAPFGYTAKVVVFIDNDGSNRLVSANSQLANSGGGTNPNNTALGNLTAGGKAYRIFEVWAGVPVDESMKIAESTVDLGNAQHGMGMQNGLLGYGLTGGIDNSLLPGFLPPTIANPGIVASPYAANYKPFTIQGTGNVNLYNLRASQKVESNASPTNLSLDGAGSGIPFTYFQLGSGTVDSRYGILAAGADPLLPGLTIGGTQVTNPNVMPQIVTSIDRTFDADWIALIQANYSVAPYTPAIGTAVANYYSLAFGGRHPLPKALPNATSPSVFGIPAIPAAQSLTIGTTNINLATGVQKPYVGVAVPLGTPVGQYSSATSNSPFSIFEDHDTTPFYVPTPGIFSGGGTLSPTISAAGPLYNGQNAQYPISNTGVPLPILPVNGEGTWRAMSDNTSTGQYVFSYLPYTYPYLTVQVKVTESPITGQFPDFAMNANGLTSPVVVTGTLPAVDPYPLETADMVGANNTMVNRPSSALTPAAWRDANGNMHVYFSRNQTAKSTTGTTATPYGAEPGAPYKMYSTDLTWNAALGTWQASKPGSPISLTQTKNAVTGAYGYDPTQNTGQWFTPASQVITAPNTAVNTGTDSDTSPFVLTDMATGSNIIDGATLFYMNSTPTVAGTPQNQIYYVDVTGDAVGTPPANAQLYFTNGDPSIMRYTPRVAFVKDATNNLAEDFLFYYGGQRGRWSIYYVPRTADQKGTPTGTAPDASVTANVETPIVVPNSIVSASEPAPVFHTIYDQRVTSATVGQLIDVIDVYYTGISRATQTPDIYMNRYQVGTQTVNGTTTPALKPLALPRVQREQLSAINHQSLWRAQNIAWVSDLSLKNTQNPTITADNVLPTIYFNNSTTPITVDGNWQYDPASGVLYQVTGATPKTLTYIYVDTASGTVRFRGAGAPGSADSVYVDYTPQAYRLTSDGASNFGAYTFTETRTLPVSTSTVTGTTSGTAASPLFVRRASPVPSGRNWLFWQKGATAANPPTLFSAERRVGVDLSSVVPTNESVQLTVPTAANNYTQTPVSVTVQVAENPATPGTLTTVPNYEFEFAPSGTGRVYIDPVYEGLPITVSVQTVQANSQSANTPNGTTNTRTYSGIARYIDELNFSASNIIGAAVEMNAGINEGQASAFLDLFDPTGINRADPKAATDPSLMPGRTWLFWSSPRGKLNNGYPNGYNTFWETLAPVFEPPLVATPSSR